MPQLKLSQLAKSYGGRRVVEAVNLTVNSGQVVGLLGPNGAGKTTTFYMTVGMIRPDAGQVYLDDEVLTDYPMYIRARKGVGYLPQETSVFKKLTVRQNILAVLELLAYSKQEQQDRLDVLTRELGISHLLESKANTLSGGERRRLEITRALATNPAFMLLDEPFAGIDPLAVIDIKNLIIHLRERNIGILISDHNVRETLKVCDQAYILAAGKVIESGSPEKIAASETARKYYLGDEFSL
ncbi:MAG: LPS export ABC transporter ATP-binding protein [Desulfobacterales bacterium]